MSKRNVVYNKGMWEIFKKSSVAVNPKPPTNPPPPMPPRGGSGLTQVKTVTLTERCKHCSKNIEIEKEEFYTIGKEPTRKQKIEQKLKPRIFFFHPECFQEVAGSEYL